MAAFQTEGWKDIMKSSHFMKKFMVLLSILTVIALSGCNMPGRAIGPTGIEVTSAFQTVQAQLTQVLAQTPSSQPLDATPIATVENVSISSTSGPTQTSPPESLCDQAAAAHPKIDITVEDDTEMVPGEAFVKTWRVVNVGTCTWTPDYAIVFFSGEQMEAPSSQLLNVYVAPEQSVDISVDMVAPSNAGAYQGNWKIRNADGLLFGIGPNGESPFWVRIKVIEIATETPIPSPTFTPTTEVQVEGPVTLVISDTLDLDNLLVNAGGVDLNYSKTEADPPQHQLVPLGDLALGFFGGLEPTLEECQNTGLGGTPITLNELTLGSYLCYHTDLNLYGWVRMDGLDLQVGEVNLQVYTWKAP